MDVFLRSHSISIDIFPYVKKDRKKRISRRKLVALFLPQKIFLIFSFPCCPLKLNYSTIQRRNTNYFLSFPSPFLFVNSFPLDVQRLFIERYFNVTNFNLHSSLLPLTLQTSFHSSLSFLTHLPPLSWYTWDPFQYFSSFSVSFPPFSLTVQWFKC